ncbi:MAG: hypothetical protein DWQ37_07985 [Planctomycetota bacterium]|nr:MAG: hypothetical protein DWQ37_07985 [Planctomycetota bacterium]
MNRFSKVASALGMQSPGHAIAFGLACGMLGAVFASFGLSVYVEIETEREQVVGVNSDAGLVGEIVPAEFKALDDQNDFVPIHQRSDYRVEPPDVLWVGVRATGDERAIKIQQPMVIDPDGMLDFGDAGRLYVAGSTLPEIEQAVSKRLGTEDSDLRVDVTVYQQNSHVYYLVTEGGDMGDSVSRFPFCVSETVLDVLSHVDSRGDLRGKRVWIARPCAELDGKDIVLPVNWTEAGNKTTEATNYRVRSGDRIFIADNTRRAAPMGDEPGTPY